MGAAAARVRIRALDLVIDLELDAVLGAALAPLISTYERTDAPAGVRFRAVREPQPTLYRNDELWLSAGSDSELLSLLEGELYRDIVRAAERAPLLHASAVSQSGRALVMAGRSGVGKSTLALALLERGARYLSEEWVAFDADGRVRGVARPLHFDESPSATATKRTGPAERRSCIVTLPEQQIERASVWPAALVLLDRVSSHVGELARLTPGQTLAALEGQFLQLGPDPLQAVVALVAGVPGYRLTFSDKESACSLLAPLFAYGRAG